MQTVLYWRGRKAKKVSFFSFKTCKPIQKQPKNFVARINNIGEISAKQRMLNISKSHLSSPECRQRNTAEKKTEWLRIRTNTEANTAENRGLDFFTPDSL